MDQVLLRIQARLPSFTLSTLSLYLAGVFLFGGASVLLRLQDGTVDYATAALAQAIGYAFGPSLSGTTMVAAAIGTIKIAIGGFFILAVTERSPGVARKEYGALNFALHGGIALTLLHLLPAWMSSDAAAIRMHAANLILLCVAVGISVFERGHAERGEARPGELGATSRFQPRPDRPLPNGRGPMPDDWR